MFRVLNIVLGGLLAAGVLAQIPAASAIGKNNHDCQKTLVSTDSFGADLRQTGIKCGAVGRSIKVHAYTKFTLSPGINSTTPWVYASSPMNTWLWGAKKNAYAWEINGPYFATQSLD